MPLKDLQAASLISAALSPFLFFLYARLQGKKCCIFENK